MSTFSGLNAATTALWAQQRALDVTGQNIANVNTAGYSRQRADLQAIGGTPVPAFFSTSPGIGAGVSADDVLRIRDAFLESRGHTEHANSAQLTTENDTYEMVQQAFREPGNTGIQKLLSDMWSGWQDVATTPKDPGARGQVLQQLNTLVGGLHFAQSSLGAQWGQARENLDVLVKDVNAAASSIANLNQAILRATQTGLPANDLMDKRDVLVMKLADQVGATVRRGSNGVVDVLVGGMSLVAGSTATEFAVQGATSAGGVSGAPVKIVTAAGGYAVNVGGSALGEQNTLNTIIPGYQGKLDKLAQDLANGLNGQHKLGYDAAGNPGTDILGSPSGTVTAANIQVLISNPDLVAASSVPKTGGVGVVDGGNADAIAQMRLAPTGADAGYRQMIVELGVQAAVAQRNVDIQSVITTQVDAARESVAGVNIDEEMTNMLQFQHAYAAAGRLVTAIDQNLDTLINRTGLVGR